MICKGVHNTLCNSVHQPQQQGNSAPLQRKRLVNVLAQLLLTIDSTVTEISRRQVDLQGDVVELEVSMRHKLCASLRSIASFDGWDIVV